MEFRLVLAAMRFFRVGVFPLDNPANWRWQCGSVFVCSFLMEILCNFNWTQNDNNIKKHEWSGKCIKTNWNKWPHARPLDNSIAFCCFNVITFELLNGHVLRATAECNELVVTQAKTGRMCAVSKFSLFQIDYIIPWVVRDARTYFRCVKRGRWRAAIETNKIIHHFEHSTNTFNSHILLSIPLFHSTDPQPHFSFAFSASESCSSCITAAFASFFSIIIILRKWKIRLCRRLSILRDVCQSLCHTPIPLLHIGSSREKTR